MKHTIKTTTAGSAILVTLTHTKTAAWLEFLDVRGLPRSVEMLEAEHLDTLIFALTETRERIELEREGAKRMKHTDPLPNIEPWAVSYVRAATTAMMPPKPAGVRCHDADACAGGQVACPSKTACGVAA